MGRRGDRDPRGLALLERPHVATEREPREGDREQQRYHADEQRHRTAALLGDPDEHEPRERGEGDEDGDRPAATHARQPVPRGERGGGEQHELRDQPRDVADDGHERRDDDQGTQDHRAAAASRCLTSGFSGMGSSRRA